MATGLGQPLITVEEAALVLGVKPRTIYEWVQAGRIPYFKLGKYLRFRRSDLEAWVESGRGGPRVEVAS